MPSCGYISMISVPQREYLYRKRLKVIFLSSYLGPSSPISSPSAVTDKLCTRDTDGIKRGREKRHWELHCTENPMYLLPEMKLRGLVPCSHAVSVSDLYIPRIGLPIWLQKIGRSILVIQYINLSQILVQECGN